MTETDENPENSAVSHTPLDALLGAAPRRVMRHWLSVLVLILAALGAGTFLVKFLVGTDSAYYAVPVERGNLVPFVSARGVIRGAGETPVRAAFAGTVLEAPGLGLEHVKRGDVLAIIDAEAVQRDIAIDRALLASALDGLSAAQVSSDQLSAKLEQFESVWRRSQGRAPALGELEAARADAARAAIEVKAASERVKAAKLKVSADQARLDSAIIRAPADGFVATSAVRVGQQVSPRDTLFTIATGTDQLHVDVPLPAAQTGPIKAGTIARVRIDEMADQVQEATLTRILVSPPGEPEARIGQFVLENPKPPLRPGLNVTAEIALPERTGVLLVPNAALEFDPAGTADRKRPRIYLVSSHSEPHRVYVTIGGSDGTRTEVFADSLKPGDEVITGWRNTSEDREPNRHP